MYCLLKYFQYVVTSKQHYGTRFGSDDWHASHEITIQSIPGWMRPPADKTTQATSLADLAGLDTFKSQPWPIIWHRHAKFPGKRELDEYLDENGFDLPSDQQKVEVDTRLCDAAQWRDCIRRQFTCLRSGLNIYSVHLKYVLIVTYQTAHCLRQ